MAKYLNLKPVEFDKLSAKRRAAVQWPGRILLPKYDGCFAMVLLKDGQPAGILSRDGNAVKSMDHIYEDLTLRYPWLTEAGVNVAVLGEAWVPSYTFAEISGAFRRQRSQPGLGFAPFDIVTWVGDAAEPQLSSDTIYANRLSRLASARTVTCMVFPPVPHVCEDEAQALRYAQNLKSMGGYDGAIASDPGAIYVVSDGVGEFLKVKPLQTFSLKVLRLETGIGEKTGKATGSLVVRFKSGECGVGTGFDSETLAGWIADPASIEGKIIEVACMDVYPGEAGMMREPRYMGMRHDVIKEDY